MYGEDWERGWREGREAAGMAPFADAASPFQASFGEAARSSSGLLRLQMPELVELSEQMLGGKMPEIRENLGKALGYFRHGGNEEIIRLRADLFKTPEQAAATLAHEIGHAVDYAPDKTLKRGNLLGRSSLGCYRYRRPGRFGGGAGHLGVGGFLFNRLPGGRRCRFGSRGCQRQGWLESQRRLVTGLGDRLGYHPVFLPGHGRQRGLGCLLLGAALSAATAAAAAATATLLLLLGGGG